MQGGRGVAAARRRGRHAHLHQALAAQGGRGAGELKAPVRRLQVLQQALARVAPIYLWPRRAAWRAGCAPPRGARRGCGSAARRRRTRRPACAPRRSSRPRTGTASAPRRAPARRARRRRARSRACGAGCTAARRGTSINWPARRSLRAPQAAGEPTLVAARSASALYSSTSRTNTWKPAAARRRSASASSRTGSSCAEAGRSADIDRRGDR